jgi:hypothetical protein
VIGVDAPWVCHVIFEVKNLLTFYFVTKCKFKCVFKLPREKKREAGGGV